MQHTVIAGDTLRTISWRYFKTIDYWQSIAALNDLNVTEPLALSAVLVLPESKTRAIGSGIPAARLI